MTAQLGYIGERLDLLIRQGATLGPFICTLSNPDASPVNLTGATIRGQIRKKAADTAVVATLSVIIMNPTGGQYSFALDAATTAGIVAGADITKPESVYLWDMELQDSLGRVIPLYWGDVRVHREVTRA